MTLLNNLYDLVSADTGASESRFEVRLREDSPIYKAHFPGMPITPGVCIVQMVKELLETAVGRKLKIGTLKNAKFLTALTPESPYVSVYISKISIVGATVSARAQICSDAATVYAKISMQAIIA